MKKILFLSLFCFSIFSSNAQDEELTLLDTLDGWHVSGGISFNISQSSFSNWATGGEDALAGNIILGGVATYQRNKSLWVTTLLTTYGTIRKGTDFNKTDDRIEINSMYGFQALKNPKWYLSAITNFKTQYTVGYADDTNTEKVSNFMAPGYLNLGLGINWVPTDYFSLNIAPANTKMIFVMDQDLADKGDYGVDAAVLDTAGNVITPGKNVKFKFGMYVRAQFNKEIFKNVNLFTTVDLFSNYLENPQNLDVNWEVLLTLKVNKWLAASINTSLIYDDDITFERVNDAGEIESYGPRVQFKEVFNLGVTVSLN